MKRKSWINYSKGAINANGQMEVCNTKFRERKQFYKQYLIEKKRKISIFTGAVTINDYIHFPDWMLFFMWMKGNVIWTIEMLYRLSCNCKLHWYNCVAALYNKHCWAVSVISWCSFILFFLCVLLCFPFFTAWFSD